MEMIKIRGIAIFTLHIMIKGLYHYKSINESSSDVNIPQTIS